MWRLTADKDTIGEFKETTNYVLQEIKIMEEVTKKMLRHDLDPTSKAYFEFLKSTISQLRAMLYQTRVKTEGR